jgi:hypothetical protein
MFLSFHAKQITRKAASLQDGSLESIVISSKLQSVQKANEKVDKKNIYIYIYIYIDTFPFTLHINIMKLQGTAGGRSGVKAAAVQLVHYFISTTLQSTFIKAMV